MNAIDLLEQQGELFRLACRMEPLAYAVRLLCSHGQTLDRDATDWREYTFATEAVAIALSERIDATIAGIDGMEAAIRLSMNDS